MRPLLAVLLVLLAPAAAQAVAPSPVTVHRDAFGVPHVEAQDDLGLAYGTGYALVFDRPFLLAAIRLTAQGRSAELLGEPSLPADIAMRRDFYDRADVARQTAALPAPLRAQLQAFADGVNAGYAEVLADPEHRPALFDALRYTPEPWTAEDSVSVTMLFTYVIFAGEGGGGQLRNAELLAALEGRFGAERGRKMWDGLLFRDDPRTVAVIPKGEGTPPRRSVTQEQAGEAQLALARRLAPALGKAADRRAAEARQLQDVLKRLPLPKIGSYAAVVGKGRTRSGGAVMVGSPQSGLNAPPVFWQVGQHAPGRDCTGFTVPGLGPWTGVGWCNDHAWSLVAGNAGEQVDNYVEELDPADPSRYRHDGGTRPFTTRTERFRVNACAPPVCPTASPGGEVVRTFEDSVHGPVVVKDAARGIAVTQRRAQRGRWSQSLIALDGWNRARSVTEFDAATDRATGTYNIVYGDAAGNTLFRFTGVQPVRARGIDRRLPSPGTGAEWRGDLPQAALPRVLNPASGILVANQGIESKPASWWPSSSAVAIGQASRVRWNRAQLAQAGTQVDADAMQALNPALLERSDGITPVFERHLRRALGRSADPRLREALDRFTAWAREGFPRVDADRDGRFDAPALTIFGADDFNLPSERYPRRVWTALLDRVFGDELDRPEAGGDRGTFAQPGTWLARLSTLKQALDGRLPHDFADDVRTPARERADDHLRASVAQALGELEREFGTPDMARWLRPVPKLPFVPLGVAAPGPITGFDHGTYSQIVDPKAGVGRFILPPGNSHADSARRIAQVQAGQSPPHFADQAAIYERYGFIDMRRATFREGARSERLP